MAAEKTRDAAGPERAGPEAGGPTPAGTGRVEARPLPEPLDRMDRRLIAWMRRHRAVVLRSSLGVVFLWFGLLKVFGASPVDPLVAATVPWVDTGTAVLGLGLWETLVGLGLLTGRSPRTTLLMLWLLLAGTFLVFIMAPGLAFRHGNPFLLTMEGEFVAKNLVLVAAGLAVGGSLVRRGEPLGPPGSGGGTRP